MSPTSLGSPPVNAAPDPADSAESSPLLLTVAQVAEALGSISTRSIWRLAATGELPPIRVGRATRWRRADVEAFVAGLDYHTAAVTRENGGR